MIRSLLLWRQSFEWLLGLGARTEDSRLSRRQTLINLAGFSAAISSGTYAVIFSIYDLKLLWPMVVGNLICVPMYLAIPVWHRLGVNTSAIVFTLTAYTSLFLFVLLLGKDSGIQLNFLTAGALAFVLFEVRQIGTIAALLLLGFVLHLLTVFYLQDPILDILQHRLFLDVLYAFSAGSSIVLVAAIVNYAFRLAFDAEEQSEKLLRNILPDSIAARLKANPSELIADRFEDASVLFADIVGFTPQCITMPPQEIVTLLNDIFSRLDLLTMKHGAEKIKTIGDAYMAVSGIPVPNRDHAVPMIALAMEMLQAIQEISQRWGVDLKLRIGIATGSITAGVIGKAKFSYDVWSPVVNLASRLESTGEAGRIHICNQTKEAVAERYEAELASPRELKGIGFTKSWFVIQSN